MFTDERKGLMLSVIFMATMQTSNEYQSMEYASLSKVILEAFIMILQTSFELE